MKKTKIHKVVLMIVDHDDIGAADVVEVLENTRYPNHCIGPHVMHTETREVEWTDDHPLNQRGTSAKTFETLFAPVPPMPKVLP